MSGEGTEREEEREKKIPNRLHTASMEPNVGLTHKP